MTVKIANDEAMASRVGQLMQHLAMSACVSGHGSLCASIETLSISPASPGVLPARHNAFVWVIPAAGLIEWQVLRPYLSRGECHQNQHGVTKMKMILVTAALLASVGTALAGSDHYGSSTDPRVPATASDTVHTGSTSKAGNHDGAPQTVRRPIVPNWESGQGIWGH